MSGWSVVCVFVHACSHTHMHKSMRECLRMCYLRLNLCVNIWTYECMCIYNSYLRISAVQWTCISRLWHFHFEMHRWIFSCTLCFNIWCWSTGLCQSLHLNRQQCTSQSCACPLPHSTRHCCHISQSASSHDTVNVIYLCWCLEHYSTLPYDNMAT